MNRKEVSMMRRPFGVKVAAALMCVCAVLFILGFLGFFFISGVIVTFGNVRSTSQLFLEMRAGIFLVLGVAYAILAVYIFRLSFWARISAIVLVSVSALYAIITILALLPHPDIVILAWQLFAIAVNAWIFVCLTRPVVKEAFASQRRQITAHTSS